MPIIPNPRHEAFAQAVASGKNGTDAYRSVYGQHVVSARNRAAELLAIRSIAERVGELQAISARGVALSAQEMHEFLRSIVQTPAGEITEASPLCQSVKITKDGKELKMPSKLDALTLSARLQGMFVDRLQVEGNVTHTVLTDDRRAQLVAKKRSAMERVGLVIDVAPITEPVALTDKAGNSEID